MFRTTRTRSSRQTDRRARLGVQALEAREVPAILVPGGRPPVVEVPDYAGATMEAAREMTLPAMQEQTAHDYLSSYSDVDMYRVTLKKGDFLVADVDADNPGSVNSTLQILDAAGNQLATSATRPEIGLFTRASDPRIGYYAPADGTFYLRLTTADTDYSFGRGYNLNLERVGIEEDQSAAALQEGGAFHAWLNEAGDTLSLTGPTGYGFSLRGAWTKTVDGSTVTYAATGTMYLRTGALGAEVALQVAGRTPFTVKTTVNGFHQLGELKAIGGKFGLSLAPVADEIRKAFGLDVSDVALAAGWTIKTGAEIKEAYQGYTQREITQLLDGAPYLVYGQAGRFRMQFGQVSVAATNQSKTVLIADPADPFLYVGYKNYAAAGSLHGRIPFNTAVGPERGADSFGHAYLAGSFPLSGLPATVNGDVTVDLDANGDGLFAGGAGNASDLFRGNLNALDGVLRDINIGVNGSVDLGYTVAGVAVRVPVGEGSVFYSGPMGGVWFEGAQGTAMNPWKGTILEKFQCGPGTKVEGFVMRDGSFSVATTSNYRLFNLNAALTLTVTNTGIGAKGTLTTPFGKTEVGGTIPFNGNFRWAAPVPIDIGGSANHIRGMGAMIIEKAGSALTLTTELDADVKFSIPGFKVTGTVGGVLKMVRTASGAVSFSGSPKVTDGAVHAWNVVSQSWKKVGSFDSLSLGLDGRKLKLKVFGHSFSMTLPV